MSHAHIEILGNLYTRKLLSAAAYEAAAQSAGAYSAIIAGLLAENAGFDRVHAQIVGIAVQAALDEAGHEKEGKPYSWIGITCPAPFPALQAPEPEDEDKLEDFILALLEQLRKMESQTGDIVDHALASPGSMEALEDLLELESLFRLSTERSVELFNFEAAIKSGKFWSAEADWYCFRCGIHIKTRPNMSVGEDEKCPMCSASREFVGYSIVYLPRFGK